MVWHILKKDLRLLWPLMAGVAALQFADGAVVLKLGVFAEPQELVLLSNLFDLVCIAAAGLLIAMAVQEDSIPGARQDWLSRPVPRRDLLLAKLLFVLIAVQVPVFLSAAMVCLAHGNSLGKSLEASLLISASEFVTCSVPSLMIAAITETLGQAIIGLFVMVIIQYELELGYQILYFQVFGTLTAPLETGGIYWIVGVLDAVIIFVCALAILPIQFFWRRTWLSRAAFCAGVCVCASSPFLPWNAAFAIQQALSPNAAAARPVSVTFDKQLGRLREADANNTLYLPLRISGLPADAILGTDWFELRLVGADGTTLYRHGDDYVSSTDFVGDPSENSDSTFSLGVRTPRGRNGDVRFHQSFDVPRELYDRIQNQWVRVEIDYSLTLLRHKTTVAVPPVSDIHNVPGLGTCASRKDETRDGNVDVYCFPSIERQACNTIFAENPSTGRRNPEEVQCRSPNLAPPLLQLMSLNGPGKEIDFYIFPPSGPNTNPAYTKANPVDASQVARSRLVISTFVPLAHFVRRITSPPIRLMDLRAVVTPEARDATAR